MSYVTMSHPWIDCARAPIYWIIPPAVMEDRALHTLLDVQRDFYHRLDHPIALVLECEHILAFNAKQRATWAEAEKELAPLDAKWNRGQAYVMESAIGRGILQAVQWLAPPVYPYLITKTTEDAFRWARERLAERAPEG